MTQCFGYVRVSTAKQGDGASLEAQKDAITGFASQNNLSIKVWYEELETASKRGRPVFDQMIKDLKRGKAKGMIAHRWDRTARNFSDWAAISDLSDLGIKVFCAGDNIDFESRSGRLMADIQMVLATDYSRNLSIEVQKGQNQRLKEGYWPWAAPIGYLNNGEGQLKTLCPRKAPLVREAFELYASGEHSLTSLTDHMRTRGLTGHNDRPISRSNLEITLRNPFYCGQLRCKDRLYPGKHEPLVSVSLFKKIQRLKEDRCIKKKTKHPFLFKRLLTCGACGRTLTGELQKGHIYYRCHNRSCAEKGMREDRVAKAVKAEIEAITWDEDQVAQFRAELEARDLFAEQKQLLASLKLRAADVQARQSRLTDLFIDNVIAEAEFKMRKSNLALDLAAIDEERRDLEQQAERRGDLEDLISFVSSLSTVYDAANETRKRELIKELFETIEILNSACSTVVVAAAYAPGRSISKIQLSVNRNGQKDLTNACSEVIGERLPSPFN